MANFFLFNNPIKLIIDSGASCCILSSKNVPEYININISLQLSVRGISGYTKTIGFIDTFITYQSIQYPIRFHVLENLPSNVEGLIGTDFLKRVGATLNFQNQTLSLNKLPYSLNLEKSNNQIWIPARTEIVAYVETSEQEACVVWNEELLPNVFISNTINT